jgi:hypothetical protein
MSDILIYDEIRPINQKMLVIRKGGYVPQIEFIGLVGNCFCQAAQDRWKKEVHASERSMVFQNIFYEAYLSLLSYEPARNNQQLYNEIEFLKIQDYIVNTILEDCNNKRNVKKLVDVLSDIEDIT